MSYILSQAGMVIPGIKGQTVSGADGRRYFFRVRDLIGFLTQRWGKAEVVKYPVSGGGTLAGKTGVILFEVSGWSNAQGHATLFDGRSCYDHCYFNEPEARIARIVQISGVCHEVVPLATGSGGVHHIVVASPC
ncbi:type VI secretion system amidase effector protein Tae4 [Massilia timonae]|uniref:type VI secretion system amidase effector protein Tae4 n=1 Tax=Massilia timonae TaxID=47229 RepID=UPI001E31094D|nr:type VI secretion system amidase effector protein Tae4 [Massilia timonae]